MATQWVFKGFDLYATYALPVPPGATATKETVKVADNIPTYKQGVEQQNALRKMFEDMAGTFAEADPFKGWAPFSYGTQLVPDYDKIEVA